MLEFPSWYELLCHFNTPVSVICKSSKTDQSFSNIWHLCFILVPVSVSELPNLLRNCSNISFGPCWDILYFVSMNDPLCPWFSLVFGLGVEILEHNHEILKIWFSCSVQLCAGQCEKGPAPKCWHWGTKGKQEHRRLKHLPKNSSTNDCLFWEQRPGTVTCCLLWVALHLLIFSATCHRLN